jgi:hypothetical protein
VAGFQVSISGRIWVSTEDLIKWVPTGAVLVHHPSLAYGELRFDKPSESLRGDPSVMAASCVALAEDLIRAFR